MERTNDSSIAKLGVVGMVGISLLSLALRLPTWGRNPVDTAPFLAATPTPDRLAEPPLPENPTQYELGRHLYWYNCMPCHGDQGQGLTDEFRQLWPEDHQNCWGRGCHGGRIEDEGYPLPKEIPAIIDTTGGLPQFSGGDELFEFLKATHPPQHPGYLPDEEYWAIVDYILSENGRAAEDAPAELLAAPAPWRQILLAAAAGVVFFITGSLGMWMYRRGARTKPDDAAAE